MRNIFGKLMSFALICTMAVIMTSCACTTIEPTEVGVIKNLGTIETTLERGSGFTCYGIWKSSEVIDLTPQTMEVTFSVGDDGAITKDMQTIGCTTIFIYEFKDDVESVTDFFTNYTKRSLYNVMTTNLKSTLKEVIGKYTIYELTGATEKISQDVKAVMDIKCAKFPINISQINVNNWDWSEDFDKQIQETMKKTQQEKTALAEVAIAEANAQKDVKVAEANKKAALLQAEARLEVAKKDAESDKVRADADYYVKQKMSMTLGTNERQWKHDETMKFLETWDGKMPGAAATTHVGTNGSQNGILEALMARSLK